MCLHLRPSLDHLVRNSPQWVRASSLLRLHEHTLTHHTRQDSSGRITQIPLLVNTQHSQETDIHDPGGIRTRNPSDRTAADPRLRPSLADLNPHEGRIICNDSPEGPTCLYIFRKESFVYCVLPQR